MQIPEGFEIVDVPLYEVRYSGDGVLKSFPDGRLIEFYEADPDQYVISYNTQGFPEWQPVRGFSIHHGNKVVIINLKNGLQIISDHDPRAVVGVEPGAETMELKRYYPDEALEKGVLVPYTPADNVVPWGDDTYSAAYRSIWAAVEDKLRLFKTKGLNSRVSYDETSDRWVVRNHEYAAVNTDVFQDPGFFYWTGIESVEHTGKEETGYDLTVPGYETFMSADGIILSNTMNVSLPSMPESVEEAKEKLMPSKMLMSTKSPDTIVHALKHEQILGLYTAKNAPANTTHKFKTEDEALEALKKGDVRYSDNVEIED